jgi:HEAT repeat protein
VRAMRHLEPSSAQPHLLMALNDSDPRVRYHAVQSIGAHQLEGVAPQLHQLVEQDPAMPVRIAAAETLGELRDSTAAPMLAQLVEDKEADLACAAIAALGNIPGAHAETALALALTSDDSRRQLAALRAIADGSQDTLLPHVQKLVQRTRQGDVRSAALSTLARNGGSGLDAVLELSATPELSADCVSALAAADHSYTPQLARALQHPNARVRWVAVESLARMKRVAASRELSIALHDEDPTVRFATSQALARLDLV